MHIIQFDRSDLWALSQHHVTSAVRHETADGKVLQGTENLALFEQWRSELLNAGCAFDIRRGDWPVAQSTASSRLQSDPST